jgi:hypothetical protein
MNSETFTMNADTTDPLDPEKIKMEPPFCYKSTKELKKNQSKCNSCKWRTFPAGAHYSHNVILLMM